MLVVVLATQFAVGGINFAPKALSFKSNRINPLSGLKRMFSLKSLVELGKALLKVSLLFASAIGVIYYLLPQILRITDGNLKFQTRKQPAALTLTFIEKCLSDCISNEDHVKQILHYIKEKRESKYINELKRTYKN